jgi:hypothetical protein
MISVLTNATLSASQLFSLAFSPSAFAQTRQNDFNIKLVAEVGVEPTVLSGLILSQLCLPFHHPAKSEALAEVTCVSAILVHQQVSRPQDIQCLFLFWLLVEFVISRIGPAARLVVFPINVLTTHNDLRPEKMVGAKGLEPIRN